MAGDTFPNAEQLFHDAFALSSPAPELLRLIKEHPTYPVVANLLTYYTSIAGENPSRAELLASALVAVRDDPEIPSIDDDDSIEEIIHLELADLHARGFDIDENTKTFDATNKFLITSLLSGLSFKHKLTEGSDQYGAILEGLNVEANSPIAEVLVTGTCIQLLINGSEIIPAATSYIQSPDEAAAKLKAQKSAGAVKNANALKLLELAISHAETGFQTENDIDNVWEILFPTST